MFFFVQIVCVETSCSNHVSCVVIKNNNNNSFVKHCYNFRGARDHVTTSQRQPIDSISVEIMHFAFCTMVYRQWKNLSLLIHGWFVCRLSRRGCTVIFSIHQPRFAIFKFFDRLLLLAAGHSVFHGEASQALPFFASLGQFNDLYSKQCNYEWTNEWMNEWMNMNDCLVCSLTRDRGVDDPPSFCSVPTCPQTIL